ncbi:MAG: hypothetical protein ACKOYC_10155 [Bacteroidota bacterium]
MIRSLTLLVIALAFVACGGSDEKEAPATDTIPAINDSTSVPVSVSIPDTAPQMGQSALRINPPHGEPGHVCEVEVGKPIPDNLKSAAPAEKITAAPNNNPITVNPAPANNMSKTISTVPATSPNPAAATAPGMNPPHGEPGHDCAIPVGAPLKK